MGPRKQRDPAEEGREVPDVCPDRRAETGEWGLLRDLKVAPGRPLNP